MKAFVPQIFRIILILGSVVLISLLYPNNARFQYNYELGQTWRYQDLYAPFNFPIKKSEEEIRGAIQMTREEFSPLYRKLEVLSARLEAFEQRFSDLLVNPELAKNAPDLKERPDPYREAGRQFLTITLAKGIIASDSILQDQGRDYVVQLVSGNQIQPRTVASFDEEGEAVNRLTSVMRTSELPEASRLVPVIEPLLKPNVVYDRERSEERLQAQLKSLAKSRGMVRKGDLIIPRNGIVTDSLYKVLSSFEQEYTEHVTQKKIFWGVFAGYFLLTLIIIGIFALYLKLTAKPIFRAFKNLLFPVAWILVFSYVTFLVDQTGNLSVYLVPYCIVPIVFKNFFEQRIAFFTHIIIILLAAFLSEEGMDFVFLNVLGGIVALLTLEETREWSAFFRTIGFIFISYVLGWVGLELISTGDITTIDPEPLLWFFLNAVLTLLAYPIIPLVSRTFGFLSSISLSELVDFNRPLLKKLSIEAPGTFQHALQVSNLSESAAEAIGARSLLVKAGALYHDIGKVKDPRLFVENQTGANLHDQIADNTESAKRIIKHVTEGAAMGEKARLPREIIDFIRTHHGTTKVEYFYRKEVESKGADQVREKDFHYPGPRPTTKEQCILMLADSIEATAKSLKEPTAEELDSLVDRIVKNKLDQQQFDGADLSFAELETCKAQFKKVLKSIYHLRVEYPKSPESQVAEKKE